MSFNIIYKEKKELNPKDLAELFLSVEWSSGHYPEKLAIAMKNSSTVYTAWHEDKLIGLINVLDDSVMTAYIHYLLVNPAYQGKGIGKTLLDHIKLKYADYLRILLIAYENETSFYTNSGFESGEGKVPMFITSLWT